MEESKINELLIALDSLDIDYIADVDENGKSAMLDAFLLDRKTTEKTEEKRLHMDDFLTSVEDLSVGDERSLPDSAFHSDTSNNSVQDREKISPENSSSRLNSRVEAFSENETFDRPSHLVGQGVITSDLSEDRIGIESGYSIESNMSWQEHRLCVSTKNSHCHEINHPAEMKRRNLQGAPGPDQDLDFNFSKTQLSQVTDIEHMQEAELYESGEDDSSSDMTSSDDSGAMWSPPSQVPLRPDFVPKLDLSWVSEEDKRKTKRSKKTRTEKLLSHNFSSLFTIPSHSQVNCNNLERFSDDNAIAYVHAGNSKRETNLLHDGNPLPQPIFDSNWTDVPGNTIDVAAYEEGAYPITCFSHETAEAELRQTPKEDDSFQHDTDENHAVRGQNGMTYMNYTTPEAEKNTSMRVSKSNVDSSRNWTRYHVVNETKSAPVGLDELIVRSQPCAASRSGPEVLGWNSYYDEDSYAQFNERFIEIPPFGKFSGDGKLQMNSADETRSFESLQDDKYNEPLQKRNEAEREECNKDNDGDAGDDDDDAKEKNEEEFHRYNISETDCGNDLEAAACRRKRPGNLCRFLFSLCPNGLTNSRSCFYCDCNCHCSCDCQCSCMA